MGDEGGANTSTGEGDVGEQTGCAVNVNAWGALQCNSLERDVLVVLADNASLPGNLTDEVAENKARSETVQRYDGSATGECRSVNAVDGTGDAGQFHSPTYAFSEGKVAELQGSLLRPNGLVFTVCKTDVAEGNEGA